MTFSLIHEPTDMQPQSNHPLTWILGRAWMVVLVWCTVGWTGLAAGQDASLLLAPLPQTQSELTLQNSSFMFQKLPPSAESGELQVNDIITVLVDYRTSMLSEGDAENRKTANLNATLAEWLGWDGKDLYHAPMRRGDLSINGYLDGKYRTESEMELRDTLTFRIAAKIVDIRPNGNLVIEAHRTIRINEEVWQQSLTGIVRRQAIGPNRTVRSDEVAELRIDKHDMGFIKDSYTRGWFTKAYDKWKPF